MGYISRFRRYRAGCRAEFMGLVGPLLDAELVRALDSVPQHFRYTRLRHSMDVAYICFCIAKSLGLDSRSAARAGLLHDLYFHEPHHSSYSLLRSHPQLALENARRLVPDLNAIEEDAILRHMWMVTLRPPRYREGLVLTMVDKYCAAREFVASLFENGRITYMTYYAKELVLEAELALSYLADQEELAARESVSQTAGSHLLP